MDAPEGSASPYKRRDPAETTSRLLEAAAAEFIARGHDSARITEIARSAGVTVGSIYTRWANKNEMMVAALDHLLERVLPDQRIEDLGIEDLPVSDLIVLWGADLLESSPSREIFTQVFGSARSNAEVQAHLQVRR